MLNYLEQKKASLVAQKVEPSLVYEDLDRKVEEYKKELYTARNAEIAEHNKLIDAQVAILDEVKEEVAKAIETEQKEVEI